MVVLTSVIVSALALFPQALVALTVTGNEPAAAVGVPEIMPVDGFSVRPAGNVPTERSHVIGAEPVAVDWNVNGVPTVALAVEALVTVGATQLAATTICNACVSVPQEFVTWTVKSNVPADVGVPLISPVEALSVIPNGNDPATSFQIGRASGGE